MSKSDQGINPPAKSPKNPERDQLAREISNVYIFPHEGLGEALHSNLSHIKEHCRAVQQICLATPSPDEISLSTDYLHGFLAVIVREVKVAQLISGKLATIELKAKHTTPQNPYCTGDIQSACKQRDADIKDLKALIDGIEADTATSSDKPAEQIKEIYQRIADYKTLYNDTSEHPKWSEDWGIFAGGEA